MTSMLDKLTVPIDPENSVIITRVENGFQVARFEEWSYREEGEAKGRMKTFVFNFQEAFDNTESYYECVADTLWTALEELCVTNSKHNSHRINILVEDQRDEDISC